MGWSCAPVQIDGTDGPTLECTSTDADGLHFYRAIVARDGCTDLELDCDGNTGRDCRDYHHTCNLADLTVTLGLLVSAARKWFGTEWNR